MLSRAGVIAAVNQQLPQSANIIIRTPFSSSITSTTGPDPTFTRTGVKTYAPTVSTLADVATTVPAIGGAVFNGTGSRASGIVIQPNAENLLLYSEDFTNAAWTAVGTGSASSNTATDPYGTTLADTISGSATGDGIEQTISIAAANASFPTAAAAWIGSVYLKTSSGSLVVDLCIKSATNTFQQIKSACRVTTTWRRFEVYQNFTSTAAGNVTFQILVGNNSTVRAFGAQLQRAGTSGTASIQARGTAGPYIKTTSAAATCEADVLTYPSATIDTAKSTGSLSFWVKPEIDGSTMETGNIAAYFSMSSERFALYEGNGRLTLWINNSAFNTSAIGMGLRKGAWNHIALSWNDSTNQKYLVVNRQTYINNTTAFTAWADGVGDLYLCQQSTLVPQWSGRAIARNFTMWDSDLSLSELQSVYDQEASTFTENYTSQTGQTFSVDLGVSPAPTIATDYRYIYDGTILSATHSGTSVAQLPYFSASDTYAVAGHNKAPYPAYAQGNANNPGMQFCGVDKNIMLQSCAPATTWTAVGAPTITDAVGNAFGATMPYGTINGVNTEGITQTNASYSVASKGFVASCYVKVNSGTLAGTLTIEGSSGGTPETTNQAFTATTTWQRVFVYKSFSGSATGNLKMSVTLGATGTLEITGMMVELRDTSTANQYNIQAPAIFIKTTTAEVQTHQNALWYNTTGNLNPTKGTLILWATLDCDSNKIANQDGPNLLSIVGDSGIYVFDLHFVNDQLVFTYGCPTSGEYAIYTPVGISKNTWNQYAVTWEYDGNGGMELNLYLDSSLVATETFTGAILPVWSRMLIGCGYPNLAATDHHKGIIGKIDAFADVSSTEITSNWNSYKAGYGR